MNPKTRAGKRKQGEEGQLSAEMLCKAALQLWKASENEEERAIGPI